MLRLKLCFLTVVSLFLLTPQSVGSIAGVVRLTNTPEQAVNLNPSLSDDGKVVVFESSANFFAGGVNDSFHALRVDMRGDPPVFVDLARSRIVSPAWRTRVRSVQERGSSYRRPSRHSVHRRPVEY